MRLTTDNVLSILLLADKYNIAVLRETCVEYMLHHIVESPDTNRTLSWYQYAKMTANALLVTKCWKFILSNFDIILKTSDWINMTTAEIIQFLSSNDLVVSDEFYLWENVEKWVTLKFEDEEVAGVVLDVIPLLHFTMMQPKQLLQIEKSSLFEKYKAVFMEKMSAAYRHHSLLSDEVNVQTSTERFRNYTSDIYGLCVNFKIEDFKDMEVSLCRYKQRVSVPIEFISSTKGYKADQNRVLFEVALHGKGVCKTFSFYNQKPKNAKLSVRALNVKPNLKAEITFIIYGRKNGVCYVAFTYTNTHEYSTTCQFFMEENLIAVSTLCSEKSPYLIDGSLEARVFVKILSLEEKTEWRLQSFKYMNVNLQKSFNRHYFSLISAS